MSSHDVRDMLNLPQDGSAPRPSKKQKTAAPRTNLKGLAREVQNLGGDHPIAIVPEISVFKKRRQLSRQPAARWENRPFKNSARGDGSLVLRHWRRKDGRPEDGAPGENGDAPMEGAGDAAPPQPVPGQGQLEDSAFAKFNVQVDIPQYNDDQYNKQLQHDDWTKDETDYLLELVRDFDLRWPVIWDRYEYQPRLPNGSAANGAVVPVSKERSMEDLKKRYYDVAAKMMVVQKPAQYMTQPEFSLYQMMLEFNPVQEAQRKKFALTSLSRSKDEAREEESLLLEVKRILARQEKFNEDRRDLYARLDYPHSEGQDISNYKTSVGLGSLLTTLMAQDKSKKQRKSLMGSDGNTPTSAGPNGPPPSAGVEPSNRRESVAASVSGHRDSIGGGAGEKATPTEPAAPAPKDKKKGAQQPERRKLTEQEEQVYGVSHHDRLGSGPTFRYEKINRLFSHKSGQQQGRIHNALNELDIPARLTMPTAAVTAQFEQLVQTVTQVVDLRKQIDKIESEMKIEQARRAEKEKARAPPPPPPPAAASQLDGAADVKEEKTPGEGGQTVAGDGAAKKEDKAQDESHPDRPNGDAQGVTNGDTNGDAAKKDAGTQGNASAVAQGEDAVDKDKQARPVSRPGSSGAHKRSASVLSATSDKSSKRQKK